MNTLVLDGIAITPTGPDTATVTLADGSSHDVLNIRRQNDTLCCTMAPILWWVPQIVIAWWPTQLQVTITGAPADNGVRTYPLTPADSAVLLAFIKAAAFPSATP